VLQGGEKSVGVWVSDDWWSIDMGFGDCVWLYNNCIHYCWGLFTLGVSKIFLNVFERSPICSPRLHLFDQKYSKNSIIVKYYYNLKQLFSILIYFLKCHLFLAKLNFQHHYSSLQCHMILQKSFPYADLVLKKLSVMLETVVLLNIFVETMRKNI